MTQLEELQREYLRILYLLILMILLVLGFSLFSGFVFYRLSVEMHETRPTYIRSPQIPANVMQIKADPLTNGQKWSGTASYYSEDGCVGCSENLTMANGKRFDEDAMTLAFNRLPLGTWVKVSNTLTGKSSIAEVTDTGGFERLGRIADLSKGLKEAIGCGDLCKVEIVEILND